MFIGYIIGAGKGVTSKGVLMKNYLFASVIAFGTLFGLSAQAAPVSSLSAKLLSQVTPGDAVQKVWHCRYWSGGWGCGGVVRPGHWRWGSRRRWWR
jgi:hypothetical protein